MNDGQTFCRKGILMEQKQQTASSSKEKSDADMVEYFAEGNAILNRMKKAILNNKGIRLSAQEMQFISTMQIGALIMDEDADPNHKNEF